MTTGRINQVAIVRQCSPGSLPSAAEDAAPTPLPQVTRQAQLASMCATTVRLHVMQFSRNNHQPNQRAKPAAIATLLPRSPPTALHFPVALHDPIAGMECSRLSETVTELLQFIDTFVRTQLCAARRQCGHHQCRIRLPLGASVSARRRLFLVCFALA